MNICRSVAAGACAYLLAATCHGAGFSGEPPAPSGALPRAENARIATCSDPATVAPAMHTRKLPEETVASSIKRRASAMGAELAFIAAIEIAGPCADLIDRANLTTLHLSTGALVSLDADDRVVVHPGPYFPPKHPASLAHPAIDGARFVTAALVMARPASQDRASNHVGIWNKAGRSSLYEYQAASHGGGVLGSALLTSTFPLQSISVLPDVDTPARMLYILQKYPSAARLLIYRWTSGRH